MRQSLARVLRYVRRESGVRFFQQTKAGSRSTEDGARGKFPYSFFVRVPDFCRPTPLYVTMVLQRLLPGS